MIEKMKDLLTVDYGALESIDKTCPTCKRQTLVRDSGFVAVDYCTECRFEGVKVR